MTARRIDLGHVHRTYVPGVPGWVAKPAKWAGDSEVRIALTEAVTLAEHANGTFTLRLGDRPLLSLNRGDLDALALTLIKATGR